MWEEARAKHWDVWIGIVGGDAAFASGIFNWENDRLLAFWSFGAFGGFWSGPP